MINLTLKEYTRLNFLVSKIRVRSATSEEMQEFLSLIQKSGQSNLSELQNYIYSAGYLNLDELKQHLDQKLNQEFVDGLIKIGVAVLIAYGLAKLLEK